MALRLIRKANEEPNITNTDDAVMVRYAYGYNGVVKNYGKECAHEVTSSEFKILSGRIVVDGWEVDVPVEGEIIDFSETYGVQYVTIFAEIELVAETATIKAEFNLINYPEILKEDDLTEIPKGSSKFELYNVRVENGIITEVLSKFEIIPRLNDIGGKVKDIEDGKTIVPKAEDANTINGLNFAYEDGSIIYKKDIYNKEKIIRKVTLWKNSKNNKVTRADRTAEMVNYGEIGQFYNDDKEKIVFVINGQHYKVDKLNQTNTFVLGGLNSREAINGLTPPTDPIINVAVLKVLYHTRYLFASYSNISIMTNIDGYSTPAVVNTDFDIVISEIYKTFE